MQSARFRRRRTVIVFAAVVVVWLIVEQATKLYFAGGAWQQAGSPEGPLPAVFRFALTYNTGGAWSIFSGATWALGVFSLVVVAVVTVYLMAVASRALPVEAVGAALVAAGGVGNAIDRFSLGHVIDFIEPTFIDYPVFNVADIGVTCGVVLFLVGLFVRMGREERARAAAKDATRDAERPAGRPGASGRS